MNTLDNGGAPTEPDKWFGDTAELCPVCNEPLIEEKCKLVCKSDKCRNLVVENCSQS